MSTFHAYERTETISHYVDIDVSQNEEQSTSLQDESAAIDKDLENQNGNDYELPHDYMEVL